jgi:Penicillin binding protein transpeptidase domain./Transglycosylase.
MIKYLSGQHRLSSALPTVETDETTVSSFNLTSNKRASHRAKWWRLLRRGVLLFTGLCAGSLLGRVVATEVLTSEIQARFLAKLAHQSTFHLAAGPSPAIHFPSTGPYDERLGYTRIPAFLDRLGTLGYVIKDQARLSPRMQELIGWNIFPIYREKTQTGLSVLDRSGAVLFSARYPQRLYASLEEIPALVVQTLLFIEDRELLDPRYPHRNPAVEWDRFAKAAFDQTLRLVNRQHSAAGGSTLATQIEKFRHSPEGQTTSAVEKLRQIVSASIRAYLQGDKTLPAQRQIILDYINAIPLAAIPNYGEVHGLGDGLWAWHNADFSYVNRVLSSTESRISPDALAARALAYKQVLSLFIAQRRPSYFLFESPATLNTITDNYLRLISRAGLISPVLRDAALKVQLTLRPTPPPLQRVSFLAQKGANAIRTYLFKVLDVAGLYDLDRLDLVVQSTLDGHTQDAVSKLLHSLSDPASAALAGLRGPHLLEQGVDLAKVRYSLILYERTPSANLIRVQTDNIDQPFDANQGIKLDLGSTAKLRTLITYLEIIAALHNRFSGLTPDEIRTVQFQPSNRLARWALDYLASTGDRSLRSMLEAAMERHYSASSASQFSTGGGLHMFANFDRADNNRVLSIREAFCLSVNLVFIRLMRDIVDYYMFREEDTAIELLTDTKNPRRQAYLSQFADQEGQVFLRRFYRKYAGKSPDAIVKHLLDAVRPIPGRLAAVYSTLEPHAPMEKFDAFIRVHLPYQQISTRIINRLYKQFIAAELTLSDRGYVAHIHPLELWIVAYLCRHPGASYQEIVTESHGARQDVYRWLFKTRHKHAQDKRIRMLLETQAFQEIHKAWQRLGYPFPSLVPSYATAIGSSADRPEALAELIGIIVNDGMRYSHVHIEQVHFAAGTPYETIMASRPSGERVLNPEIAAMVKQALFDVVEQGTARRLRGTFRRSDGSEMPVGGKTGTGDHRYKIYASGGQLLASRVMNRAATFVFIIDDRLFGTITAYVPGREASAYSFTSALAVQVLKYLAPVFKPLLHGQEMPGEQGADLKLAGSGE